MSVHVTVNKTHVCVRPKRFLSSSESQQIRENERARRRRLRIKQVREQSKDISKKVLQQAKSAAQKELHYLESNEQSELKRLRDEKILEIQRRYQEDMEDIGLAHETAAIQPNADNVLQAQQQKNQLAASARGKAAMQRLTTCVRAEDLKAKQQETRRQVREVEDLRSSLVASLAKKSQTPKPEVSQPSSEIPSSPKSTANSRRKEEPKKRRIKKTLGKKSPVKVVSKPSHVKTSIKSSPHTHIPVNDARSPQSKRVQSIVAPSQPTKSSKYNPSDYIQVLTCSNTSSGSSLISDDSSYFSEGNTLHSNVGKMTTTMPCQTENCPGTSKSVSTGVTKSQIKLYDHQTRHRGVYIAPDGLVERTNIQNEPSAHEIAQRISEEGPPISNVESQRLVALQRGQDAALRDQVRRNYQVLLKNLDNLSREERKLNATRTGPNMANLSAPRRKEVYDKRQRVMNRAFDAAASDSEAVATKVQPKAIITLDPDDEVVHPKRPQSRATPYRAAIIRPEEDELSREEQILDMLKKVERQKRLLLKEFGAGLPDDILSASLTPLFNVQPQHLPEASKPKDSRPLPETSPEIKVINMSECDTSTCKSTSSKPKSKIKPPVAQKTEAAVQTKKENLSREKPERTSIAEDKGTQVELSPMTRGISSPRPSATTSRRPEYVEPVVTIITHGADTSTESSDHKFVINVAKGTVEVTPRKLLKSRSSKSRSISSTNSNVLENRVPMTIMTSQPSGTSSPDSSRDVSTSVQSSSTLSSANSTIQSDKQMRQTTITQFTADKSTNNTESTIEIHDSVVQSPSRSAARRIDSIESSDRSTSYASLPAPRGKIVNIPDRSRVKDILELVDSSANETLPRAARDVSPVSTPATPSSSVMGVSSNIPNASRLARILTYSDAVEQNETLTPFAEKGGNYNEEQQPPSKPRNCRCSNPQCLFHHRKNSLSHRTEIECEQRIASLEAQLHQVRDEQRSAVDYSFLAPSDTTSFMQMPQRSLTAADTDIQSFIKRLTSIENKLARTLKTPVHVPPAAAEEQVEPQTVEEPAKFLDKVTSTDEIPTTKPRPIVVSDEPVKFDLQRFRAVEEPENVQKHDDNIVEKLSREILLQTQAEKLIKFKTTSTNVESQELSVSPRRTNVDRATEIDLVDSKMPVKSGKSSIPILVDTKHTLVTSSPLQIKKSNDQKNTSSRIQRELDLSRISEAATPKTLKKNPENTRKLNTGKSQNILALTDVTNNVLNIENKAVESDYSAGYASRIKSPEGLHQRVKTKSPSDLAHKHGENYCADESVKSSDSLLIRCSTRKIERDTLNRVSASNGLKTCEMIKSERITTNSSNSISSFSGISEIMSTPSSDSAVLLTTAENIEDILLGLGVAWLVPFARKTREASALSSSSNSDVTHTKRTKSPIKKNTEASWVLPELSDVSSISIKEASKSTEKTVLMRARTSTPNMPNVHYISEKSSFTTTSTSHTSVHDHSDGIFMRNLSMHLKT